MNPSTALATVLIDELARVGVRDVVLCPGSRSAPLGYAVHAADAAGRLRLHVRVDERSAAFLALGLGKVTGVPAAIITTSGTAVANLHPAVLEAHEAAVPLLVLSCDRPPELRGTRANQTTDQVKLFAGAVRWYHEVAVAETRPGQQAGWRTAVDRAYAATVGDCPGPVHLNVPFRDPLAPDAAARHDVAAGPDRADTAWDEPLGGRPHGAPWTDPGHRRAWPQSDDRDGIGAAATRSAGATESSSGRERTLLLIGDLPAGEMARTAARVAERHRWPVLAEPFGAWAGVRVPGQGVVLASMAADPDLPELHPERVIVAGRPTLNRATAALLRRPEVIVEAVSPWPAWPDPGHVVRRVHPWPTLTETDLADGPDLVRSPGRRAWWERWNRTAAVVRETTVPLIEASWPSGAAVARTLVTALGGAAAPGAQLFVGSSNPARDLDGAFTGEQLRIVANRGLAGIDGCLGTAIGLALSQPSVASYALVGDLTFLHDSNALVIGPGEPRPDLTIVVVNDDGGGIFSTLEYGEPARLEAGGAAVFERIFGTPTGADLASLCRAARVPHELVDTPTALSEQVRARWSGLRVLEVRVPRPEHRTLGVRLRAAAGDAVRRVR